MKKLKQPTPSHVKWLILTGETAALECGRTASIYRLAPDLTDQGTLKQWARHFRGHYCSDDDLKDSVPGNMSKSDYLKNLKFPHHANAPGPSIRSGDFAEILVADFLQYLNSFVVPRTRYDRKVIANESSKGSDVIGFRKQKRKFSKKDELLVVEVKAAATEHSPNNALQNAIDGSIKDEVRLAESLNAMRQRLRDRGDSTGVELVGRYQDNVEHPYRRSYGAAAVVTQTAYSADEIAVSTTTHHPHGVELALVIITCADLMHLIHSLYDMAANEI